MTTIDDILEQARLNAATPAEAMRIEDLQREHQALADAMSAHGYDADDVASALAGLKALREHIRDQPFEVMEYDHDGYKPVDETTPGAFEEWLEELERLA